MFLFRFLRSDRVVDSAHRFGDVFPRSRARKPLQDPVFDAHIFDAIQKQLKFGPLECFAGQDVMETREGGMRSLVEDDPTDFLFRAALEFGLREADDVCLPVKRPPVTELNGEIVPERNHARHHQGFLKLVGEVLRRKRLRCAVGKRRLH
jgi:hypothetical protein